MQDGEKKRFVIRVDNVPSFRKAVAYHCNIYLKNHSSKKGAVWRSWTRCSQARNSHLNKNPLPSPTKPTFRVLQPLVHQAEPLDRLS